MSALLRSSCLSCCVDVAHGVRPRRRLVAGSNTRARSNDEKETEWTGRSNDEVHPTIQPQHEGNSVICLASGRSHAPYCPRGIVFGFRAMGGRPFAAAAHTQRRTNEQEHTGHTMRMQGTVRCCLSCFCLLPSHRLPCLLFFFAFARGRGISSAKLFCGLWLVSQPVPASREAFVAEVNRDRGRRTDQQPTGTDGGFLPSPSASRSHSPSRPCDFCWPFASTHTIRTPIRSQRERHNAVLQAHLNERVAVSLAGLANGVRSLSGCDGRQMAQGALMPKRGS
jgi:hypothetical protein